MGRVELGRMGWGGVRRWVREGWRWVLRVRVLGLGLGNNNRLIKKGGLGRWRWS